MGRRDHPVRAQGITKNRKDKQFSALSPSARLYAIMEARNMTGELQSRDNLGKNVIPAQPITEQAALQRIPKAFNVSILDPIRIDPFCFAERGRLGSSSVLPPTMRKYCTAMKEFQKDLHSWPSSIVELDIAMQAHIERAFDKNPRAGMRQQMVNLLCMTHIMIPSARNKLGYTHRALRGWEKQLKPQAAFPLTKRLCFAMVSHMLQSKKGQSAIALLVAWAGLSGLPKRTAGVVIKETKTGPNQFVLITDEHAVSLISKYMRNYTTGEPLPLFTIGYETYESHIKVTAQALRLGSVKLTSHSASIGGALHDYFHGKSAETIAITGRWKSLGSLRTYLTNGRSEVLKLKLKSEADQVINNYEASLLACLPQSSNSEQTNAETRRC
ncbi:DNA breaking-rejoining enzyme [Gracilaria domingensis]|nr:DNA breaking-rejoining enzyme [Gracilaria domingensis]